MLRAISSRLANTVHGAQRPQDIATGQEEEKKSETLASPAAVSETPLTNLPKRRYVLETPKNPTGNAVFTFSGASPGPVVVQPDTVAAATAKTPVAEPVTDAKTPEDQPTRGRSMLKSAVDRAASVDVSRFIRTPGVDLDDLTPPEALQNVKLPRKLRKPATAVAASLPMAAKAPTPKNMVHAAKDMDALRNEVWSPITNTETYQEMDGRLKKHPTAYQIKSILTKGPLMTYLDHRKEKREEKLEEKREERKAAVETRKSLA